MQIEVRKKLQNYNEVLHVEHKGMGLVDDVVLEQSSIDKG